MKFQHEELPNGLTIIGEHNPHAQSAAAGFFVRAGSRDESADVSGVSHFLEHMAFKGTDKYTADDVNRIFDEIGAQYNASTSEEATIYYAAVLPEYLPKTIEMLSGLIQPSLRDDDFNIEKKVILEEIGMYDDQPSFLAYDKAMATHFAGHPLGNSILGSVESITALRSEQMRDYHRQHYHGGDMIFAITGAFDWREIIEELRAQCDKWPVGHSSRVADDFQPVGGVHVIARESSHQEYLMAMGRAPSARSEMRFAAELLSIVVGDDAGSRLYWELVDPGHAEACELGFNEYDGTGTWMTYLGCQPEALATNRDRVQAVFDEVNANGVTDEELTTAKNKVLSRLVLRSERPMGRLSSLGGNWLYRTEYRSLEDDLASVEELTIKDLRGLLDQFPLTMTTTVAIGPLEKL